MSKIKPPVKYLITFGITAVICIVLLILTACIPRDAIQKNYGKSLVYWNGQAYFPYVQPGKDNTKLDYYADNILFRIIYHIDGKAPFSSVIAASYDFQGAGKEDYSRYWHGSMVLLRPLLCVTDIVGIHKAVAVLLTLLFLGVEAVLIKDKCYQAAVIYPLGLCLLKIWIVAGCMEYAVTFLLMQAMILAFWHYEKSSDATLYRLSMISGMLTCFMDFLTTETLTITVPLFFLWMKRKKPGNILPYIKALTAWGVSYAGMFALKWGLSAMLLGKGVLSDTLLKAGERIKGNGWSAVLQNIYMLFPPGLIDSVRGKAVCICIYAVLLIGVAVFFAFPYKKSPRPTVLVLFMLIPYFRYLILGEHSYTHYFFTYRAQLITVLVILFCVTDAVRMVKAII